MILGRDAIDEGLPNPRGRMLSIVSIVFVVLSTSLVALRLASLRYRKGGLEDATIAFASVLAIALTVLYNEDVKYGWGFPKADVSKSHLHAALRIFYVNQIFYKVSTSLTKISILLLYLRIFTDPSFRRATYAVLAIVVGYGFATTCASIWQCTPIRKTWLSSLPGHCVNSGQVWYATAALVISTDVMLIVLPVREVLKLHMRRAQKIGLIFCFALGFCVIITTVVRICYLSPATSSADVTYYQAASNTWTSVEVNTGIMCACVPTLKGPIAACFPRLFATTKAASRYADPASIGSHYSRNTNSRKYTSNTGRILSDVSHGTMVCERQSDEEMILYPVKKPGEIMKTTNVDVDYNVALSEKM